MAAGSEAPPAKPRAPAWASAFGDPSGMIDLAWAAAHRWLGFESLRVKICRRTGTIYRAFLHRIVDGKDSNTFLV
jgi:hypothetical protein